VVSDGQNMVANNSAKNRPYHINHAITMGDLSGGFWDIQTR